MVDMRLAIAMAQDFTLDDFRRQLDRGSDRKLRLFGCACCRTAGLLLKDPWTRRVVETAERYADEFASGSELAAARAEADAAAAARSAAGASGAEMAEVARAVGAAAHADAWQAARGPLWHIARAEIWRRFAFQTRERWRCIEGKFQRAEQRRQMEPLRCIFGNPFRQVEIPLRCKKWNGGIALKLGAAAYEERQMPAGLLDPDRLAVLADALEEAGCREDAILAHLRSPGPHVRGCWAVDLVLDKK
jgi:hypothetical protein